MYNLCTWVIENVIDTSVSKKYQSLHTAMNQNNQPSTAKVPIETQKKELLEALRNINLFHLSAVQIEMLKKIDLFNYIGNSGAILVEKNLRDNSLDSATATENINTYLKNVNKGITVINQIFKGLDGLIDITESEAEATLRIRFTGDASIENISDLKKMSGLWYDIGRGIAMYHDDAPENVRVLSAENGSIVFVLGVTVVVVKTLSDVVLRILSVNEKIIDIKIKKEELKKLELENDKIELELEKEIETQKEKVADEIMEELKSRKDIDPENQTILRKSLKNIIEFMDKGGEVDIVINDISSEDMNPDEIETLKNIKGNTEEIRRIEDKIKLIEMKKVRETE